MVGMRSITNPIKSALNEKIVLLTGPRQAGKTSLAKSLYSNADYLNYDAAEDRLLLRKKEWDRNRPLIIFDELHKMKEWKRFIKGVYDKENVQPQLLVTGSAKLDTYRKVGDSLAGRYFQYRLYPFDIKEALQFTNLTDPDEVFHRLMNFSGFPEPFFKGSEQTYKLWRRSHLEIILRQDLIDLEVVRDIQSIETLVHLLKQRVGGTISYANLARDLDRDIHTVQRWLRLLENLYVVFRVTPYHHNVARSLLKAPKFYFFDIAQAENGEGARLENLVAVTLLKHLHFIEDTTGIKTSLHYLRTKDEKEIDFLITFDSKPVFLIEVKSKDDEASSAFKNFMPLFRSIKAIQLVKECAREKTFSFGLELRALVPWLAKLDLLQLYR